MHLVACRGCRAQFDVSRFTEAAFACPCGAEVEARLPAPVDAPVARCGSCGAAVGSDVPACDYCRSPIVRDPARLGLVCPVCYARNPDDGRHCTGCGVEFLPQPPPLEMARVDCPVCECDLAARSIGGIVVSECGACGGVWAPGDRFDVLVRRVAERDRPAVTRPREQPPFPESVVYRVCPVCRRHMHRTNFGRRSGIIVDSCADHGTWLDAGELRHVAEFVEGGGLVDSEPSTRSAVSGDAERILAAARRENRGWPTILELLTELLGDA